MKNIIFIINRTIIKLLFHMEKNKMSQIRHKCIDEHKKRDYYGYIKLTGYKNKLYFSF